MAKALWADAKDALNSYFTIANTYVLFFGGGVWYLSIYWFWFIRWIKDKKIDEAGDRLTDPPMHHNPPTTLK